MRFSCFILSSFWCCSKEKRQQLYRGLLQSAARVKFQSNNGVGEVEDFQFALPSAGCWCRACTCRLLAISRSSFYRWKGETEMTQLGWISSLDRHRAPPSFALTVLEQALLRVAHKFGSFAPDADRRYVPFATWRQLREYLELTHQVTISPSQLNRVRKRKSCRNIQRLRTTDHARCSFCDALCRAIAVEKDPLKRLALEDVHRLHIMTSYAHRETFYKHNAKSL